MDQKNVEDLIRKGETKEALKLLEKLRPQVDSAYKVEIDLMTARFNTLQRDLMLNQISYEEGSRETARITNALLQLTDKIFSKEGLNTQSNDDVKKIIKALDACFYVIVEESPSLRLREKNQIVNFIYSYFLDRPKLIHDFIDTDGQAIISAIALKFKIAPNIDDLKLLKQISKNASTNFTKGHIVNALAEFVYSGQLRFGDETIIFDTLNVLKPDADIPLLKNIERVEVALQYFLGQIK